MRTCAYEGCSTRLSAYNAYETCHIHTFAWNARKIASAKRTRKPAAPPALTEVVGAELASPVETIAAELPETSRIAS